MENVPEVTTVDACDAETRLGELLDRVERGEQVVFTRHGKAIARLVPEGGHDKAAARAAVAELFALGEEIRRRGVNLSDEEIRAMRDEGRRY